MHASEQLIHLSAIDTNDDFYRISGNSLLDALVESIRNIGLVNIPVLQVKGETYRIVCGFKRIHACSILGMEKIHCRVLDRSTSEIDCLKMAIADNAMASRPGILEEARAVTKLGTLCASEGDLPRLARPLGIDVNTDLAEKYRLLCALPETLQHLVENSVISMKIAIELGTLEAGDSLVMADLFETLRPTASQQKEILSNLKATSAVMNHRIADLLELPGIYEVFTNQEVDRKHKIRRLRWEIRKIRYPYIARFESRFHQNLGKMGLKKGISLIPPRDFESPVYTFSIDFTDTLELGRKADWLKQICESRELKSLLHREIEDT